MQTNAHDIDVPQARFLDDRVARLLALQSDEAGGSGPSVQPGDGVLAAMTCRMPANASLRPQRPGRLAPWQLRRVLDYLQMHFPERIDLATLAAQINLSQAHFSRAFKTSTGLAPYQWQLTASIRHAQCMLAASDASLDDIAHATGFADTVHFGRTFRKLVGVSPGAWRCDRKR